MHFATESIAAIGDALVVPRRFIFKAAHGHEFLQDFPSAILVRQRVFVIDGDSHRKKVAVNLHLIAVAIDDRLLEGRPAAFHVIGQAHQMLMEQLAFRVGNDVIAPVIDPGGGVDGGADFAGDVQLVAVFHPGQIIQHQLHRFPADLPFSGHKIIKSHNRPIGSSNRPEMSCFPT